MLPTMRKGHPLRWIASIVIVLVVTPVVGDFFSELARRRGAYDDPEGAIYGFVSFLSGVTEHRAYPYILGFTLGTLFGFWFHLVAAKFERKGVEETIEEKRLAEDTARATDLMVRKLGEECVQVAQDMFRFMSERTIEFSARRLAEIGDRKTTGDGLYIDLHMKDRDAEMAFQRSTAAQLAQRFGTKALLCVGQLRSLGIAMPPHLIYSAQHSASGGVPQVLSVMGGLLKNGQLEEAVALSQNRDFMWSIQH